MMSVYRMGLIAKKNNPDVIAKIAENESFSARYANFLISRDMEIPEIILHTVSQSAKQSTILAIRMKEMDRDVPYILIEKIASKPEYCADYISGILAKDRNAEINPMIWHSLFASDHALERYVNKIIQNNQFYLPLPEQVLTFLHMDSDLSLELAKKYITYGGKKYADLNPRIIEAIKNDSRTAEKFAQFLEPFVGVDNVPEEILDAVEDDSKIHRGWSQGGLKENFEVWFYSRN